MVRFRVIFQSDSNKLRGKTLSFIFCLFFITRSFVQLGELVSKNEISFGVVRINLKMDLLFPMSEQSPMGEENVFIL